MKEFKRNLKMLMFCLLLWLSILGAIFCGSMLAWMAAKTAEAGWRVMEMYFNRHFIF